ncbi:hypothetical protein PVBG_02917 [Plasmodium vivax Brazil I]|uniref:DUF1682 domain-containing protein n=1 Tax=Plasmodium vivax (strain Brazil I) TaxID=1033975 RepID=A0A0J9SW60_PLAV1|nr:hypothetical protein PVBG_02917 [Plasmodium vivax Brazil I]
MRKFRTVILFLVIYLSFYLTRSYNDNFDDIVIVDESEEDRMKSAGGAEKGAEKGAKKGLDTEAASEAESEAEPDAESDAESDAQQLIHSWAGDNENLLYLKIGIFLCLLVVTIANGVVGRKTNRTIALYWLRSCKDIFLQNFAKLGNEKSFLFEKSYDKFEFYCTGRKHCNYYFVNLNLCKRQCLWRYYLLSHFVKENDSMSVAIHFDKLDKGVLCVFKKHQKKYIDCRFPNLNKYTKMMAKKELKGSYEVKGDSNEIMELVLNGKILNFLNTYDRYVNYVCITDIALFDSEDRLSGEKEEKHPSEQKDQQGNRGGKHKFCFLNFVIPKNVEDLRTLVSFSIYMIDACYCIELSEKVRDHVRKMRSIVEKEDLRKKQQLKELQERKKAQKLQEEKERVEKMSAEQQRKYEEKKQKKSLKKMKKIKIIKM